MSKRTVGKPGKRLWIVDQDGNVKSKGAWPILKDDEPTSVFVAPSDCGPYTAFFTVGRTAWLTEREALEEAKRHTTERLAHWEAQRLRIAQRLAELKGD